MTEQRYLAGGQEFFYPHVGRDDYRQDMNEIKTMLGKIFDKLDLKQDK